MNARDLETLVLRAHSGNSLLFLGAGFTTQANNEKGTPILMARDLSRRICQLGNFEEDEDLAYSADYYIKHCLDTSQLIALLRDTYTITNVGPFHEHIARIGWRRVYTTNYDNCFELASSRVGRHINPITLEQSPRKFFRSRDICVHVNGAIQSLDHESLDKSFRLTESSYTNSDAFSDSSWSYRFKKDLEICSQIVFVGYSLYDMEVRRLLVGGDNLIRKTYFVTAEGISTKELHRLSTYGQVVPIGVEEFGRLLSVSKPERLPETVEYLASLKKEEANYGIEYSDSDIRDFLLRGKFEPDMLLTSLTSSRPYAIERSQVPKALDVLDASNILVIHGTLANGKTVMARQMVAHLLFRNQNVYTVKDEESDYETDIDRLAELNQRFYLVLDDFEKNLDIALYFASALGSNGKLILTERSSRYRRAAKLLDEHKLRYSSMNVDYLHEKEVEQLAQMLTNAGLWGTRGGDSSESKLRYLTKDCESQLSILLMNLLKAPHVLESLKAAFSDILRYPDTKKTVHAICLIQHIYPVKCTTSFISRIADSNHVYSKDFEDRISESGLFEYRGDTLTTRSSVFCTFMLNSLYNASYSIDQMVRILAMLEQDYGALSHEERELSRSIMTFTTLSAVLPERDKNTSYIRFFERLKSEVPKVVKNAHYWLQYAMALMSDDRLSDAERYLDQAYSIASKKEGYDTAYIDNQFARLNLRKAISEDNPEASFGCFKKAHDILKREQNDMYKFRQAGLYIPYYNQRYETLSKKNQVNFEHSIKEITKQYEVYLDVEYAPNTPPPYQVDNLLQFKRVIGSIVEERGR